MAPITATAINCSLSARGRKSSTDAMLAVLTEHFEAEGVRVGKPIRIAAHSIKWGVTSNEGAGDEWPRRSSPPIFSSSAHRSGWVKHQASPSL